MPRKKISSAMGPIKPPTRKKIIKCSHDVGLALCKNSSALIPAASNIRNKTPAAIPKQADQSKPLMKPTSIFDRERPIAPGSPSSNPAVTTSKSDSRQRSIPSAGKGYQIRPSSANRKPVSIISIPAIETMNVFREIWFASIQGTLMPYRHTSDHTSYLIF